MRSAIPACLSTIAFGYALWSLGSRDNSIETSILSNAANSMSSLEKRGDLGEGVYRLNESELGEFKGIVYDRKEFLSKQSGMEACDLDPAFKGEILTFATNYLPESLREYNGSTESLHNFLIEELPRAFMRRGIYVTPDNFTNAKNSPSSLGCLNFIISDESFVIPDARFIPKKVNGDSFDSLVFALRCKVNSFPVRDIFQSDAVYNAAMSLSGSIYKDLESRDNFATIASLALADKPEVRLLDIFTDRDNGYIETKGIHDRIFAYAKDFLKKNGVQVSSFEEVSKELIKVFSSEKQCKLFQSYIRERDWPGKEIPEWSKATKELSSTESILLILGAFFAAEASSNRRRKPGKDLIMSNGFFRAVRESYGHNDYCRTLDSKSLSLISVKPQHNNWLNTVDRINEYWRDSTNRPIAETLLLAIYGNEHPMRDNAIWCMSSLEIKNYYTFKFVILLPSRINLFPENSKVKAQKALNMLQFFTPYYDVDTNERTRGLLELESIVGEYPDNKRVKRTFDVCKYLVLKDLSKRSRLGHSHFPSA